MIVKSVYLYAVYVCLIVKLFRLTTRETDTNVSR